MIDTLIIKQFKDICDKLNCSLSLYSSDGKQLYPENQRNININLIQHNQDRFIKLGTILISKITSKPNFFIATEYKEKYSEDILTLVDDMLAREDNSIKRINTKKDAYQHIITANEISINQIRDLAVEHKLPTDAPYCILLVSFKNNIQKSINIIKDLYPIKLRDCYFAVSGRSNIIVHYTDDYNSYELSEFVNAFNETLQEESGEQFSIGVSEIKDNLFDIRKAAQEAKKAISIGERVEGNVPVYIYNNLLLERIVLELPANVRQVYVNKLFNDENKKLLNDEMILTINAFLSKDLNLSDASRHLFIHRNTLVYRLEKIQKSLGLDLRKFNDASTFNILSTIQKLTKLD